MSKLWLLAHRLYYNQGITKRLGRIFELAFL